MAASRVRALAGAEVGGIVVHPFCSARAGGQAHALHPISGVERGSRAPKHDLATYRRNALTHPVHALLLGTLLIVALAAASLVPLCGVVLLEPFVVLGFPRFGWFRESVDAELDRLEHERALALRRALLSRMSEGDKDELAQLERLVAATRARTDNAPEAEALIERLGLPRLLVAFTALAVNRGALDRAFPPEQRELLRQELSLLEWRRETTRDEEALVWIGRRVEVLRKRLAAFDEAAKERELAHQQLAVVSGLVRQVHEQCARAALRLLPLPDEERPSRRSCVFIDRAIEEARAAEGRRCA
jgi:hypothetical protein